MTVNNYDWELDRIAQVARREARTIDFDKLKLVYIDVLLACVEYYDAIAQTVLGRSPKHILLLHENDLAALFITD